MTVNTGPQLDQPKTKLIEIAYRITDREAQHASVENWLKAFRKNYRHMAVTYGMTFDQPGLGSAEAKTDEALNAKAREAA